MTLDMEKFDVLNAACAAVCTSETVLQKSNDLDIRGKVWSKEDVLLVEKAQVRKYLGKLDM